MLKRTKYIVDYKYDKVLARIDVQHNNDIPEYYIDKYFDEVYEEYGVFKNTKLYSQDSVEIVLDLDDSEMEHVVKIYQHKSLCISDKILSKLIVDLDLIKGAESSIDFVDSYFVYLDNDLEVMFTRCPEELSFDSDEFSCDLRDGQFKQICILYDRIVAAESFPPTTDMFFCQLIHDDIVTLTFFEHGEEQEVSEVLESYDFGPGKWLIVNAKNEISCHKKESV